MQEKIDCVIEENTTLQNDLSRLRAHVYMKDTQFSNQTNAFLPKNSTFPSNNGHSSNVTQVFNTNYSLQRNMVPQSPSHLQQNNSNTFKGYLPSENDIDYMTNIEYNEKYVSSHNIPIQKDNSYSNILSEKTTPPKSEKSRQLKDGLSKTKIVRFVDDLTSSIRSLQTELLKPSPFVYPHCEAVNTVVFNILNSVPKSLQRKSVVVLMQKLENSMYKLESICSNPNINVHEASLAAFALALAAKNLFLTCE